MKNVGKLRVYDRIRLSWLRNNGNNELVAQELDLPHEYVRKITWKLKKEEAHDSKMLVANDIMRELYFGIRARTQMALDAIHLIHGKEFAVTSVCCKMPVREGKAEEGQENRMYCIACGAETEAKTLDAVETMQLRRQLISDWRVEAYLLLKAAVDMGYTTGEKIPAPVYKSQILVVGGDRQMMDRINEQSPADRQKVIQDLENEIFQISEKIALIDLKKEVNVKNGQGSGKPTGSGSGAEVPREA